MARYVCESRGRLARLRRYPAVLRDRSTGESLLVRSATLGEELARFLAADDRRELPRPATVETPFSRYECVEQVPGVFRLFVGRGALLGDPVALGSQRALCSRAADVLNRVDPAEKLPVRTGIGWW